MKTLCDPQLESEWFTDATKKERKEGSTIIFTPPDHPQADFCLCFIGWNWVIWPPPLSKEGGKARKGYH